MSEQRPTLEKIAPTIEEAIAEGLEELGLAEDDVEVEILDDGSRGLFGLRSRQARVRLTIKSQQANAARPAPAPSRDEPAELEMDVAPPVSSAPMDEETENAMEIARATVSELLERMHVRANVTARLGEVEEAGQKPPIVIDINGNDLSILIGRRAETLNALQYITRLIVGKELGRAVHLLVDVEGYRRRRERNLRSLAQRMARQAVKTGRRQMLEPMSPAERRIIHIELRDNQEVTTESVGDEPRRKVTIIPV